MLGVFIIIWIAGMFYDLAKKYQKNKWLFAIGGIAAYYLCNTLVMLIFSLSTSGSSYNVIHTIISVLTGFFGCYLFYMALKNRWNENQVKSDATILDEEFISS